VDLIRINKVVEDFGLSSRTLRYYEEKGLLWSHRPDSTQRYYDAAALERLRQIIILRKLQIPIKDITAIFERENTSTLIQAFVDKLDSLDGEISALSELRHLVDDFLHKMLLSGIKKISAITLLYEETEKRLALVEETEAVSFEKLSKVSRDATRLRDVRLIRLPPIRVLSSRYKTGEAENLDEDKMQNLFINYGLLPTPGMRDCFMRQETGGEWLMLIKIPDGYKNETPYTDERLPGGLYAVASTFFENLDETLLLLKEWVNNSNDYKQDAQRHEMLEEILPWDIVKKSGKFQQDIFIPIVEKEYCNG